MKANGKRLIKQYDANGDGKLSRAEFQMELADIERMSASADRKYHTIHEPLDLATEFKQRDLNSDGFIELDELTLIPGWTMHKRHDIQCR